MAARRFHIVPQHFHLTVVLDARHEVHRHSGLTLRRKRMNRMNIFQALRSGRCSALVALVASALLFTATGAKAGGCFVSYKAGAAPSIPFVSPQEDTSANHQAGAEWDN